MANKVVVRVIEPTLFKSILNPMKQVEAMAKVWHRISLPFYFTNTPQAATAVVNKVTVTPEVKATVPAELLVVAVIPLVRSYYLIFFFERIPNMHCSYQ